MRSHLTFALILGSALLSMPSVAQDSEGTDTVTFDARALVDPIGRSYVDSIEGSFTYQRGEVALSNGVAKLALPTGFKFLDEAQTQRVLVDLWGEPERGGLPGDDLPGGGRCVEGRRVRFCDPV